MSRYWVYLNDEVAGPFAVEQLIRQRGFSRQTLVCVDDASGKPTHWTSPAEIPELAHIFKAVDEQMAAPFTPAPVKTAPKPAPARPIRAYTPAVTLKAPARDTFSGWLWFGLAALLVSAGIYTWLQYVRKGTMAGEQAAAQALVENAKLPSSSLYSTLRQYLQEKDIKPKWEFERVQDGLYHATLSWYPPAGQAGAPALTVYAFEANVQAQTVRGLNTAAAKLLSEGFPSPAAASKPKPAAAPKKLPAEQFPQALDGRREALESGNFAAVWDSFSARKKSEMARGGISRDGFLRVQNLTHRVDTAVKQTVLKTKPESDTDMLVLIKQSQSGRPDIFVKQLWVYSDGAWKLDDEQQRSSAPEPSVPAVPAASPQAAPAASPASPNSGASSSKPAPAALPGMSN